jgi:hypothetical protein
MDGAKSRLLLDVNYLDRSASIILTGGSDFQKRVYGYDIKAHQMEAAEFESSEINKPDKISLTARRAGAAVSRKTTLKRNQLHHEEATKNMYLKTLRIQGFRRFEDHGSNSLISQPVGASFPLKLLLSVLGSIPVWLQETPDLLRTGCDPCRWQQIRPCRSVRLG